MNNTSATGPAMSKVPPPRRVAGALGEGSVRARRALVALTACAMVAAAVAELPGRMSDFAARARENAALDYADLEIAGGNSLVADQEAVYQARAIIPPEATYDVSVGPGVEGATDLTPFVADYYHYFLIPRKQVGPARWVVCYACDRSDVGAHTVLWENDGGISILRRDG